MKKYAYLFMTMFATAVYAQQATIREYEKEYTTYPYSDPNPIPAIGKIYPYFRYDGYTTQSKKQVWKIVEMENNYLRVRIFPQIGGKIWSVYDKKTGKEMFYNNDVVKFRDIALRGPWTSGGIEFNYGVVGHAPTSSFPVDYLIRTNPDQSVSCVIGVLDLLTRSRWNVEINLPADKGCFTTQSFWQNTQNSFQPYYNWVNASVNAKDDLRFTYPGTHIIQHDGKAILWPLDTLHHKDLSLWRENNFIGSKSYHIFGSEKPYFGAYWSDSDYGILQFAGRDQKIGRKIFTWALSDQGTIWEDLLTDHNGQYVELQSGRLFNQNMVISSLTPFKQIQFAPYSTDVWKEYWFPYHGIGLVNSVNRYGACHVEETYNGIALQFYPIQDMHSSFCIYNDSGQLMQEIQVKLTVSEVYSNHFLNTKKDSIVRITLGQQEIWSKKSDQLNRPAQTVAGFNWNTAYGTYLRGRDLIGMRLYDQAETFIHTSLSLDSTFVPSLAEMAALYNYKMEYDSAYICAKRALAIDTYDARANYEFGRAALQCGHLQDAYDGFELATLTVPLRSAAYTELSKLSFIKGDRSQARKYASQSLVNNIHNMDALQLIYLCNVMDQNPEAQSILKRLAHLDPLNPFISFERYFSNPSDSSRNAFSASIRSDLSQQVYLELAIYYHHLHLDDRAVKVLSAVHELNGEIAYWLAYLHKETNQLEYYLKQAEQINPAFVFPFRVESQPVFEWAAAMGKSWKPYYYLALLKLAHNQQKAAVTLLNNLDYEPDFSPFYALRANLNTDVYAKESDIKHAIQYDPKEWRYRHLLVQWYLTTKQYQQAYRIMESWYNTHKDHSPTGVLYVKTLIRTQNYKKAEEILSHIHILPFEGERGGRLLYQEIKLMLALQALNAKNPQKAIQKINESFLWPRHIGAGKPYEETIDKRLENWLLALAYWQSDNDKAAQKAIQEVANSTFNRRSVNTLLQILALYRLSRSAQADDLLKAWIDAQPTSNIKIWGGNFVIDNKIKSFPLDYKNLARIIGLISGSEDIRLF